ncbi:hypothetical protein [Gracilimonas sp.]|uniref:hypothetical protein n=1 Tax=Gracilimonas sp. TaxID=1974203 RepID=UPI002870F204|nr:hypothetical protein [Gracilimonas sp.]
MYELIKDWNPWVKAILIAIGIELLFSFITSILSVNIREYLVDIGFVFALPALKISGYETAQAILNFSGDHKDLTEFAQTAITTGISVFVIFIVGPYLLLRGYKQSDQSENPKQRSWSWYIGAIMIMMTMIPAILSSVIGTKVYMNTKESMEDSRQKDLLNAELMDLALDASYKIFMPQEKGGGEGSFTNMTTNSENIKLEHLDSYEESSMFDFKIQGEVTDSSFTIVGVTQRMGEDEDFENANGETGKQQISVVVSPYEENIFTLSRANSMRN